MTERPIYLGQTLIRSTDESVEGRLVMLEGAPYYEIVNFDRMRPFFMSAVSSSDHWTFISSTGALTAGRKNAEKALFPYYTDDKIHDAHDTTGSKTAILVEFDGKVFLWEPFSTRHVPVYDIQRNLYKHVLGNRIRFQEMNRDLGLTFEYEWAASDSFGFVKRSKLINNGSQSTSVRILDGLQNLLPYGVNRNLQTSSSTLVDAYKKAELLQDTGLGVFLLSSIPVDRPEPSEALKATTVWSAGLDPSIRLLSTLQLDNFRRGYPLSEETDVRAERGAYFVHADVRVAPQDDMTWYAVAEIDQGPAEVALLQSQLEDKIGLLKELERDMADSERQLVDVVAGADGLQQTEDALFCARHLSNTLFNVMRGGTFVQNGIIHKRDFRDFVELWNRPVIERNCAFLAELPDQITTTELVSRADAVGDAQLTRLCYEYLPLNFSRRHGDPSRPWNEFSIETRKEDGSRNLHYEGNWRDIFQNWEALALSYPTFLENMICKFANGSTPDGYNPYRISRHGIDWEVIDPHDPWSHIGYWGDHQLIYLLKLLELARRHYPETLDRFLGKAIFSYANVPYRISPYEELLQDPRNTVSYDVDAAAQISDRVSSVGADGKLVWDDRAEVYLVNLAEKVLVSILAKLANFIPEAGIWMNTQRPEWNDANNALVGNGISVITLCYLRRYLQFCTELFEGVVDRVELSEEVAEWLVGVTDTLDRFAPLLTGTISDTDRRLVLDALGRAASSYRMDIYSHGFTGNRTSVDADTVRRFLRLSVDFVDHSVMANQREDKLFHAYNILTVRESGDLSIGHLYEMLEGQVAALSSGLLSASESVEVLAALRASAMYREDQKSYTLYPDRQLPRFVEKNNIPARRVAGSDLLGRLLSDGDRHLVVQDVRGQVHFNGVFRNKMDVDSALDWLSDHGYQREVETDRTSITDLFEEMFDHQSYTGRSGTFYGYEGLGSIYWHMVSKLLLAVGETFHRAIKSGEEREIIDRLAEFYYDIRFGIGIEKNPSVYGAFPIDPYSHTPGTAGVQQPGMTGQVKEDLIARWAEFGVTVSNGCIEFQPALLRNTEFLSRPSTFEYIDVLGDEATIELPENTLGFTYCQVPIIYRLSDDTEILIEFADGDSKKDQDLRLDPAMTSQIFERSGIIRSVQVSLGRYCGPMTTASR